MSNAVLTVTQLIRRIKHLLERDIGSVWVEGEVSNLRQQTSGHWYFTIKDESAQLSCAMFSARRREGHQALRDGARVKVHGETTMYEARGSMQLIVERVEASGQGDLQARFEALKRALHAEGLFDPAHKKALPAMPQRIGVVTSATGAVLQDMQQILGRRAPWLHLFLTPVRVQGKGAEHEIAAAIDFLNAFAVNHEQRCDVIVVGRGGGSLEDLWAFNEEVVARAIARSRIPIISAVGHEIDVTIADFAADLRAPTPSAAAELLCPSRAELMQRLDHWQSALQQACARQWRQHDLRRANLQQRLDSQHPQRRLRALDQRFAFAKQALERESFSQLDHQSHRFAMMQQRLRAQHPLLRCARQRDQWLALQRRLLRIISHHVQLGENRVNHLRALLRSLGPESTLQRGYSISFDAAGEIVRNSSQLHAGDVLLTRFAHGSASSRVETISEREHP